MTISFDEYCTVINGLRTQLILQRRFEDEQKETIRVCRELMERKNEELALRSKQNIQLVEDIKKVEADLEFYKIELAKRKMKGK